MNTPGWNNRSEGPDADYTDAARGERIQKVLALAGVGSRRTCEQLLLAGEVTINGRVVDTLPAWVDPKRDRLTVRGKPVHVPEKVIWVMLFKPRGVVSTAEDPKGRPRAIDLVRHPSGIRVFPVGRLDVESSGLLLLTNDGDLSNRLTHPRYGVHKTYEVTVAGRVDEDELAKLERGIFLSDHRTTHGRKPGRATGRATLSILRRERDRTHLLMELSEGRNRQIRRMMLAVGHKVRKLRRVQVGPLKLSHLRPGEWRELTPIEIKMLRKAARREPPSAAPHRKPAPRPAKGAEPPPRDHTPRP